MSESTANTTPGRVDLSDLRLMPAWVGGIGKEAPAQKFRDYEERGPSRGGDRRDGGGDRGRGKPFGGDRGGERSGRPGKDKFGGRDDRGPRGDRRNGPPSFEQREPIPQDITVTVEVEDKATDSLAAHIRSTGRAFSMFDASRLVLESGERFHVKFQCAPERPSGLFRVQGTPGLFLSREEALKQALAGGALDAFYRMEEIELEEPKGEFKSIGVCGMSGHLFGPPSHHSYQTAIIRHHRDQFSNMALEDYKRRIRIESDPELVAKWKEQQRKGTRWIYLKAEVAEGAEPPVLSTRAEMEAHFRRLHADTAVIELREALVPGQGKTSDLSGPLLVLLRRAVETARNHLFEFSQRLGHALEHRGLKLFKRRSGKLFVSRVKPRAIDPGVIFSERIKTIVDTVKNMPGITIAKLVDAVALAPEAAEPAPPAPADVSETAPPPAAENPETSHLSDAQIAVIRDLRWLADEGYVIEYSDNAVFLGVQSETPAAPKAPKAPNIKSEIAAPADVTTEEAPIASEAETKILSEVEPISPPVEPEPAAEPILAEEVAPEAPVVEQESPESVGTPVAEQEAEPKAEAELETEKSPE